jgi:molecular chaperone DnaK
MIPGIDAGTHGFKVAVSDLAGNPQILTNRLGETSTRSVVFFPEDGTTLVGTEAENAALANPEKSVFNWKRHMGTEDVLYQAPDGKVYKAKDILAIFLKEMKDTIEAKTGEVCQECVITIPANYHDIQKEQTREAADIVGLKILCLAHEPTAAALGNEIHKKKNCRALVCDVGGGTTDVSIVQTRGNLCEVMATNGESKLGGIDFNRCLEEIILEQFEGKHRYRPNPKDHPLFCQDMSQRVEQLKLNLTANKQAQVVISCNGDQFKTTITRDQFNSRVLHLVELVMKRAEQTVKDANLSWNDIDEVYAVGGASMPPIVIENLEKLTGKKVSRRCEPHCAAALGAVIAGRLEYARLSKDYPTRMGTLPPPNFYLREILSRPIGVAVLDDNQKEICSGILEKRTPIPSIQTRVFKMSEPNQTDVLIRILDGEDSEEAGKCVELGQFELNGLPARPDLIGRVEVTFHLDINGMLTATARDTVSGKAAELKITYKKQSR